MLLLLLLLLSLAACPARGHDAFLKVCRVENPTHAAEYRCVSDDDSAVTNFSWWYKPGQNTLPDGVQAVGDTLHFLKWTSDVSGTYYCVATSQNGPKVASLFTYIQNSSDENFSTWIINKVTGLWTERKLSNGLSQALQC